MQSRNIADLKVPAARTADLVTTESKDEVLVYDQKVHHIHHLNAVAAKVWRLCDGERTVSEIAAEARLAEDAVKLALRTLEDAQLLDGALAATFLGAQSRRSFLKKAAIAGAVPAMVSVTAPIAAAASSGNSCEPGKNGKLPSGCGCTMSNQCEGACKNNVCQ